MRHRWLMGLAIALIVVVGGAANMLGTTTIMCDGVVPAWVDPAHQSTGCVTMPPMWEYAYPWHWGAEDVCLGMCLEAS